MFPSKKPEALVRLIEGKKNTRLPKNSFFPIDLFRCIYFVSFFFTSLALKTSKHHRNVLRKYHLDLQSLPKTNTFSAGMTGFPRDVSSCVFLMICPGTPFVSYFFRQLYTPKTSNPVAFKIGYLAFQVLFFLDLFCFCFFSARYLPYVTFQFPALKEFADVFRQTKTWNYRIRLKKHAPPCRYQVYHFLDTLNVPKKMWGLGSTNYALVISLEVIKCQVIQSDLLIP